MDMQIATSAGDRDDGVQYVYRLYSAVVTVYRAFHKLHVKKKDKEHFA